MKFKIKKWILSKIKELLTKVLSINLLLFKNLKALEMSPSLIKIYPKLLYGSASCGFILLLFQNIILKF